MSIRQNVIALMERECLSQDAFARKVGISQPAVSNWVSGIKNPSMNTIKKICGVFGLSQSDLVSDTMGIWAQLHGTVVGSGTMVPLLGYTHMGDTVDEETCERYVEVPSSVVSAHPKAYCVHADGCCMDNRYPDDSVLLIDPTMQPFNGCAVLAETEDYQSVVRVYSKGSSTLMLSPDSHSGEYEDIIVRADDAPVKLKGVVVWYQAEKDVREA